MGLKKSGYGYSLIKRKQGARGAKAMGLTLSQIRYMTRYFYCATDSNEQV